jgi:hypothetical protein
LEKRTSAWSRGLTVTDGGEGLIGNAGVVLLRELAESCELRKRLSKVLGRPGFDPGHDRGQVLIDLACAIAAGARSISGISLLQAAGGVLGPLASVSTAWRALGEIDEQAREAIADARAAHRRRIWAALMRREAGFPWLQVAGRELTGWIVVDIDASVVESHSDKEGAAPSFKHIFGYHPLLCTCANTGENLAGMLRPGNAGSNTACDHIEVLTQAIEQIPPAYRKKIWFRIDGAGATKQLLAWIKTTAAEHAADWRYSVGFDVTEPVREAIGKVPHTAWADAIDADGRLRTGARVTEITGLLDLPAGWPAGMRLMARLEPLHPRHRKNASAIEKRRNQRFCVFAFDVAGHHYAHIDARHRNHATVEDAIRHGKDCGLGRFPSQKMQINKAWLVAVMLAADLLTWLRLLGFDHDPHLATAEPKTLRRAVLSVPARLVRTARRRYLRLPTDWTHTPSMITAWGKIRNLAPG